jgi:hypothetical protein
MENVLPEAIQNWLDRNPTAKRAYDRIRADVDCLAAWVENTTRGELRDKVAAFIDPPSRDPLKESSADSTPPSESIDTPKAIPDAQSENRPTDPEAPH